MNWHILYIITLLLVTTFYDKEFLIIINNTQKQIALTRDKNENKAKLIILSKNGIFSALGFCSFNFITSIFGLFLCLLLGKNATILMYFQILCIGYVLYAGIKQMTQKSNLIIGNILTPPKNYINAFYSSLSYSMSRYELSLLLIAIVAQFYENANSIVDILFLITSIFVLQYIVSFIIILMCNCGKIVNFLTQNYCHNITRVAGFMLILLSSVNVKQILKF